MGLSARMGGEPGVLLRLRYEAGGRQGPGAAAPVLPRARRAAPQVAAAGAARRSFPAGHSGGGAGEPGTDQVRSKRPGNLERLRQSKPAGQSAAQVAALMPPIGLLVWIGE